VEGSRVEVAKAVIYLDYYWWIQHHLDSIDWTVIGGSRRVEGSHAEGGRAVIYLEHYGWIQHHLDYMDWTIIGGSR